MTRIMIVDDAAADRVLAARLLKRNSDWETVDATDGKDALEKLAAKPCDLVLTDLQMPEMDGLELVSEIKERYPRVPCILMTSSGSEEAAVRALKVGAASYVPKRLISQDLVDTVGGVLIAAGCEAAHRQILERVVESQTRIRIESSRSMLASLLEYLRGVVQATPQLDTPDYVRLGIVLDEALTNALYHGNLELSSTLREGEDGARYYELADERCTQAPYNQRGIEVTVNRCQQELRIVVRDDGPGFDVSTLPDPTDPEYLLRPHGRGIMLIRTFLDDVSFNDAGNEITMIRRLDI